MSTGAALASQGEAAEAAKRYARAQAALSKIQDLDPLAMIGIIRMTAWGLIQGPVQAALCNRRQRPDRG